MKKPERNRAMVAERQAGLRERAVAARHGVSKRTVRKAVQQERDADPEAFAARGAEVRAAVMAAVDAVLLEGLQKLGAAELGQLKPAELSRVLADVARVRRDMATAAAPGEGEHPSERLAREAPELRRESVEEWNRRFASYEVERAQ